MSDYALATNLATLTQSKLGYFAWPASEGEGETIRKMAAGDCLVPKFSQSPDYRPSDDDGRWEQSQRQYIAHIGVDYDEAAQEYEATVNGGQTAVPFLLRVTGRRPDEISFDERPWASVAVEREPLPRPLSTREFLLLRALPLEIARQFKGTAAPGRHIQPLPQGVVQAIREAASADDLQPFLRRYSIVKADDPLAAADHLAAAGRPPLGGDRAFLVSTDRMVGLCDANESGALVPAGDPIPLSPGGLSGLLNQARERMQSTDYFAPQRALSAARELDEFISSKDSVRAIDDFGRFHDGYVLLASKVTQARHIAKRPPADTGPVSPSVDEDSDEPNTEDEELGKLQGLDIASVRHELPNGMLIPDAVIAEAVASLQAGKHLLLSGPPGTGKSTFGEALCRAVVDQQYRVVTATADWTTFDTFGGYVPTESGKLDFDPGVVLSCLARGAWLVIDEMNRADIDKAFGPLFTLLAGGSSTGRSVELPYRRQGQSVEVRWVARRSEQADHFELTPSWRLIGTLNVSDKATLFQLSFAFLRRFAVIDVPLPDRESYRAWFDTQCPDSLGDDRQKIIDAGIELALGPKPLGPAILQDVGAFLDKSLTPASGGKASFSEPREAFFAGIRLFAVPQYEGATRSEVDLALGVLKAAWPDLGDERWASMTAAFDAVALT